MTKEGLYYIAEVDEVLAVVIYNTRYTRFVT